MQYVPADPPYPDLSDLHTNPGADRQAMLQNNANTVTAQIRVGNYNNTIAYLHGAWTNFVLNMQSGQILTPDRQQAPQPPMALVMGPPDADGLVAAVPGNTPVIPIPPLPPYAGGLQAAYHNAFSTGAPAADIANAQFQTYVRDALGRLLSKTGA